MGTDYLIDCRNKSHGIFTILTMASYSLEIKRGVGKKLIEINHIREIIITRPKKVKFSKIHKSFLLIRESNDQSSDYPK